MSDVEKYIRKRTAKNPKAWADFESKYRRYAIGLLLAEHRQKAGLSLSKIAQLMKMQKSAVSRIENHGVNVSFPTISRYVKATGQPLVLKFSPTSFKLGKHNRQGVAVEVVSA